MLSQFSPISTLMISIWINFFWHGQLKSTQNKEYVLLEVNAKMLGLLGFGPSSNIYSCSLRQQKSTDTLLCATNKILSKWWQFNLLLLYSVQTAKILLILFLNKKWPRNNQNYKMFVWFAVTLVCILTIDPLVGSTAETNLQ